MEKEMSEEVKAEVKQVYDEYSGDIVYFFLCEGFIKIGKVTPHDKEDIADPENEKRVLSRLSACKTGNPKQIYLLGYLFGKEDYWHRVFYEHKHQGEWYRYDGLKGIIFSLRLRHSNTFLEKWKEEVLYALEEKLKDGIWHLNEWEKKEKKKKIKAEIKEIEKYSWEQYIKKVSGIKYTDIESEVIENRFTKRNGRNQLEINQTKNFSRENWQLICEGLGILFRTNVDYKEKRKSSIVDEFHDVIHEGDMYYNPNIYVNCAHGLSERNAVYLYQHMHPDLKNMAIKNIEAHEKKMRAALDSIWKPRKAVGE